LEEEDQSLALDILRVISFSERTLDVAEVVEAVAVTPKTRNLRQLQHNTLRRPNDVFELCGSLIQKSQTTGKVSLSHYSVKEFLSRPILDKGRRNPFFLQEMPSQRSQVEKCISYLTLEDFILETFSETLRFALDPLYTDSDFQAMTSFPFLDYASNYWAPHLKQLGSEDLQAIWPLLKVFLDGNRGSFESWILISQYNHGDYKFPRGAKAVHVAALYGLEVMLARLLQADPSSRILQTSDGRTALHIALENQQERIIDLLLDTRVKSDRLIHKLLTITDERGRTPLHTAIESGSEGAVITLVTAGANVNAIQSDGRTLISVAVENRWNLLAEFLSEMVDPTQKLSDGRSLLHIAAESGSLAWTMALLKFNRDTLIDARDGNNWTPLHYAIDREHLHITRALVESNCLIEVYDANGWTPLHAAIRRRNLECASLILNKDWSVSRPHSTNPGGSSSLDVPSASGQSIATTTRLVPPPSLTGKYTSERRQNRPSVLDSMEYSVSNLLDAFNLPKDRKHSPLHLAVTEFYIEGVELLAQHQAKFSRLGCDRKEKLECLNMVIESADIQMILLLMKMISKSELEGSLLKLVMLSSDPIKEYLRMTFTSGDIYVNHIPEAALSNNESAIPSLMCTWPDADETAIHAAIGKHLKLGRIFIENGITSSKVLMEESEDPLLHRVIV
jgi:ankyrin repeat protein